MIIIDKMDKKNKGISTFINEIIFKKKHPISGN